MTREALRYAFIIGTTLITTAPLVEATFPAAEPLTKLTYIQLSVVESLMLYQLSRVHRWALRVGPFFDALIDHFGRG